uniref:Uncharacterized protein n=1 Tax=Rhizophora mucronata TaxID=61149 RepID=A0A2P2IWJ6_RHIMU
MEPRRIHGDRELLLKKWTCRNLLLLLCLSFYLSSSYLIKCKIFLPPHPEAVF